ncbi:DUF5689 domain-containing protein [Olivibacter oleidegradans]|uniref:DUF5689 domain-containing protein n=1 Tax=Olivibacter oleidegradans TaxID=760123 RepID=A0ABV6HUM1_9SPHI
MKKTSLYLLILLVVGTLLSACTKTNYPGGEVSPYIGIYDLRSLYKDSPVTLTVESLGGSSKIAGWVISDHREGNLPEGLLTIQDKRRLNFQRGISIALGAEAADYLPGDSVVIDVVGAEMNRVDGILQLSGISTEKVTRVASGLTLPANVVTIDQILLKPNDYESTLVAIVKGGFNPIPKTGETVGGSKTINDGFGNLTLETANQAAFANQEVYKMANYYGIIFNHITDSGTLVPYHRPRRGADIVALNSDYAIPKVIITGFASDPRGTDANNEYIQLMATQDIDFSKTPFSLVTTNNANASTPTGFPANGWATGGVRTYKFNLSSGFAPKGTYFYVGGTNKRINSTNSTDISSANWITAYAYNSNPGFDFGNPTTNLLANSGNASGIAVFEGTEVTKESVPVDVIFVGTGGSLFNGSNVGYPITNTDWYDIINPLDMAVQAFYRAGTNTKALTYHTPSDAGYFYMLGGKYNLALGRWTKARSQGSFLMTKETQLEEIEGEEATKLLDN